jgi:hypothetical protein
MNVTVARYALGIAALLIVCGSLGYAAVVLRRRWFPGSDGALARLCEAVVALALLIAVAELLGAIGLFRLVPIAAACAVIGAVALRAGRGMAAASTCAARKSGGRPSLVPAIAAAFVTAAVAAEWASPTLQSYDVGIRTFDSLWYHLPWAASFAQTGHITPLRFTDVEYLTAFYPASAEMLHGLGIVLLGRDTLSPALNLAWLGLALLAAYCIGRPRGLGGVSALGAGLALATPTMNFSQAGSAANDVVGVAFLLAAVALLVNAEGRVAAFVLAAVAAGLAVSVKLSLLAPVLALTIGALVAWPRPRAGPGRVAALWLGPLALAGGFWYARNLIAVGNPLPWASLGVFATPAPPLQQHTGFSVAHYLFDSRIWSQFFEPGLASGLGRWWWAVLAAAVLGPVLCLLPGSDRTRRMLGAVALAALAAYLVTPETAAGPAGDPSGFAFNLRYAAPALTLALAITPLAPVFGTPRRAAALALALVAVLIATVWQAPLWPTHHVAGAIGVGAALLLVAAAVRLAPPRPAVLGTVALAVAVAIAGYPWQRHYLRGRYAFQPGVSYLARTWALFRGVHKVRVGVVGTFGGFFSYPLFGADGSNRVQYVGQRGPHGSFTPIASCSRWRAALNRGRYQYVVTTPARDPWHPKLLSASPETAWTASDPAARVVYSRLALGQRITVFELSRPMDPTSCS